jgi:hypothetical protein
MRFGRTAVLLALASLPAVAVSDDRLQASSVFGSVPISCALVGIDRQICTWHEGRSHHVVCEIDSKGQLVGEPCVRSADNESMRAFPSRKSKYRSGIDARNQKEALRREAKSLPAAARSLRDVIDLVGAGPSLCMGGDVLSCRWHAVRRTPGFITLSRIANTRGMRLDLICKFKSNGDDREQGSCNVGIAGRTPQK